MNEPIDHDAVSELLDLYLRGELPREQAIKVSDHLTGCPDCSKELVALEALGAETAPAPLTEFERAGLRRAVLSQAVPLPDSGARSTQTVSTPERAGARWFQALGAVALVAAIAGFAYLGLNPTGGDDSSEESGADVPSLQMESEAGDSGAGGAATMEDSLGTRAAKAPPAPTFEKAVRTVDSDALNEIARRGLPLVVFSRAYSTEDVSALQNEFVEQLAAQAEGVSAENIRTCAALVFSQTPVALPAYAAEAIFEPTKGKKSRALVLGFAWTGEDRGPLERSMVWAWPLGDCDTVFHYSEDVIRPRR